MMNSDVRAFLPLKPEVFDMLLALEGGELHGYAMLKALEAQGTHLPASLLYRKLRRLMVDALVEESNGTRNRNDDARRRYYRLTPLGRAVIHAEAARVTALAGSNQIRRLARRGHA